MYSNMEQGTILKKFIKGYICDLLTKFVRL